MGLRILAILLVITLFAGTYLLINEFTVGRDVAVLNTPLDDIIPFVPFFVYFYLIAYIMNTMGASFVIINEKTKDFRKSIYGYVSIILISSLIYFIFPVKTIRPEIAADTFTMNVVYNLYSTLLPYNLFPSLHVGLSIFTSVLAFKFKNVGRYLFAILAFFITLSTLLIKEHYIIDLIAAMVLVLIVYYSLFENGLECLTANLKDFIRNHNLFSRAKKTYYVEEDNG